MIYRHRHFVRIAGGKPFKDADATFVAHRRAKRRLAARAGKCRDTVEKEAKLEKLAHWPNDEVSLPFILCRYCGLWGRGT